MVKVFRQNYCGGTIALGELKEASGLSGKKYSKIVLLYIRIYVSKVYYTVNGDLLTLDQKLVFLFNKRLKDYI
jgi:hypothetical protein